MLKKSVVWFTLMLCMALATALGCSRDIYAPVFDGQESGTEDVENGSTTDQQSTGDLGDSTSDSSGPAPEDSCRLECEEGQELRPVAMFQQLGTPCETFISPEFCAENAVLTRGFVVHLLYWFLPQDTFEDCENFEPLTNYEEAQDRDWYEKVRKAVLGLQCIGVLSPRRGEYFCGEEPACIGWWEEILDRVQNLP